MAPEEIEFSDVRLTDQGVGTYYSWATTIAGIPFERFDVFTEFVPNQRIVDRSSSPLEGDWTYTFEPEGSGTRLIVENRVRAVWSLPLLHILDRVAARTHAPRFAQLKALLER